MTIIRISDPVERYRRLATSSDIHSLSGHDRGVEAIDFVNSRVLDELKLQAEDILLDVGCGDGSLVNSAADKVVKVIGVTPTLEEQTRLQTAYPNISFVVGLVQGLPLESGLASRIVCNGVLPLLGTNGAVFAALKELARVAQADALIWLGEIPAENENEHFKVYCGDSVLGFLAHQLRYKGIRQFLYFSNAALRGTVELNSSPLFYAPPDEFTSMVGSCGLRIEAHFKHRRLDKSGKEIESPFRYNYLVRKD